MYKRSCGGAIHGWLHVRLAHAATYILHVLFASGHCSCRTWGDLLIHQRSQATTKQLLPTRT